MKKKFILAMFLILSLILFISFGLISCTTTATTKTNAAATTATETTATETTATETTVTETIVAETTAVETVYSLTILNGVGTQGIAAKTSELFKGLKYQDGKDKYNISKVTDADNHNYKNTQIVLKSEDADILIVAEEIKSILNVGTITTQQETSEDSDIVIIIGKDFNYDIAKAALAQTGETTTTTE
jgi:hypothetical protein